MMTFFMAVAPAFILRPKSLFKFYNSSCHGQRASQNMRCPKGSAQRPVSRFVGEKISFGDSTGRVFGGQKAPEFSLPSSPISPELFALGERKQCKNRPLCYRMKQRKWEINGGRGQVEKKYV